MKRTCSTFAFVVVMVFHLIPGIVFGGWFSARDIPDISIDRIVLVPAAPKASETFKIQVVIRNEGKLPLKEVFIRYSGRFVGSSAEVEFTGKGQTLASRLNPGDKTTLVLEEIPPLKQAGIYTLELGPVLITGKYKDLEKELENNSIKHAFAVVAGTEQSFGDDALDDDSFYDDDLDLDLDLDEPEALIEPEFIQDKLVQMRIEARELQKKHKYIQSNRLYKEIIKLADAHLGKYHSFTMVTLEEQFKLVRYWKNKRRIIVTGEELIERFSHLHGEGNDVVIGTYLKILENLGLKDHKRCLTYYEKVCTILSDSGRMSGKQAGACYFHYVNELLIGKRYDTAMSVIENYINAMAKEYNVSGYTLQKVEDDFREICRALKVDWRQHVLYERIMKLKNEWRVKSSQRDKISSLRYRAWSASRKNAHEKAYSYLRDAEGKAVALWPLDSPHMTDLYFRGATIYHKGGKFDESRGYLLKIIHIGKASKNATCKQDAVDASFDLAELYEKDLKDMARAGKSYVQALKMSKTYYGEGHFDVGKYYHSLGMFYKRTGKDARAVKLLKLARDRYVKYEGPKSFSGTQIQSQIDALEREGH